MSVQQWVGNNSVEFKSIKKALVTLKEVFNEEFTCLEEAFAHCGINLANNNDSSTISSKNDTFYKEDILFEVLGPYIKKNGYIEIFTEDGNGPGNFLSTYKYDGKATSVVTTYCLTDPNTSKTACIDINDYDEEMTDLELLEAHKLKEAILTSKAVLKKFNKPNEIPLYYSESIIELPKYLQEKPIKSALIVEVPSHGMVYLYWCSDKLKVLDRDGYDSISGMQRSLDRNNIVKRENWIKIETC